jgi:hypothetical protein
MNAFLVVMLLLVARDMTVTWSTRPTKGGAQLGRYHHHHVKCYVNSLTISLRKTEWRDANEAFAHFLPFRPDEGRSIDGIAYACTMQPDFFFRLVQQRSW